MYSNPEQKFDLVSCQFAFHYCFETQEQAECMVRNAAECLKQGGYFIGTTPDANLILSRLSQGKPKFGNSVYSVEFDSESTVGKAMANGVPSLADLPKFGNKYNFHLEGVVDCPEFLVNFDVLTEIADRHGLMLVGMQKFENHFKQKREKGGELLKRIKALELYPPAGNVELVGKDNEEENYCVARDFIERYEGRQEGDPYQVGEPIFLFDKHRKPMRVGTMSKEEWEAVSLYTTFAFKKQ